MARIVPGEVPRTAPQEARRAPGTRDDLARQRAGVGRLGTAAAWIFAICCLPYLVLKVVWTLGLPVGIADQSVLESNGWVAGNALMAVIQLVGLLLVLALIRPWARRISAWLLLVPVWVGTGLLFQVVGAVLFGLLAPLAPASRGSTGGIEPWVFVLVYAGFTGQGAALALAFAAHVRARWGRLLGARTGAVVARRTARGRSWPEAHLTALAEVVAALAIAVALICWYWAAGGAFGLSGSLHDPWEVQASRGVGALMAAVGLLGLAGRGGQRTRFWLPAALTWVGSGALAAFDGFTFGVNQLFFLLGLAASAPGWSLSATVLVTKVVLGVVAGALGALAITAAAKDTQTPAGPERTRLPTPHGAARPDCTTWPVDQTSAGPLTRWTSLRTAGAFRGEQAYCETEAMLAGKGMKARAAAVPGREPTTRGLLPVGLRQPGQPDQSWQDYRANIVDDAYLAGTQFTLHARATGYTSDRQVWETLRTHPGYAVVDYALVPFRHNYDFSTASAFQLKGFYYEDASFAPVRIEVRDARTGVVVPLTVIGVLDQYAGYLGGLTAGVYTGANSLAAVGDASAPPDLYVFRVAPGQDVHQTET